MLTFVVVLIAAAIFPCYSWLKRPAGKIDKLPFVDVSHVLFDVPKIQIFHFFGSPMCNVVLKLKPCLPTPTSKHVSIKSNYFLPEGFLCNLGCKK
jgi:hypothetical protein